MNAKYFIKILIVGFLIGISVPSIATTNIPCTIRADLMFIVGHTSRKDISVNAIDTGDSESLT